MVCRYVWISPSMHPVKFLHLKLAGNPRRKTDKWPHVNALNWKSFWSRRDLLRMSLNANQIERRMAGWRPEGPSRSTRGQKDGTSSGYSPSSTTCAAGALRARIFFTIFHFLRQFFLFRNFIFFPSHNNSQWEREMAEKKRTERLCVPFRPSSHPPTTWGESFAARFRLTYTHIFRILRKLRPKSRHFMACNALRVRRKSLQNIRRWSREVLWKYASALNS